MVGAPRVQDVLVLGVDPGLTRCGLGAVSGRPGRPLTLRHVEVVSTTAAIPLAERLMHIGDAVERVLDEQQPAAVALERVFSQHNVATVMGVAQASGVVMQAAARRGIPVVMYTPSEVKAAVSGSGRAGKAQVQTMVARLLGQASIPGPADAADSLALAICHIWRGPGKTRLAGALAGTGVEGAPS